MEPNKQSLVSNIQKRISPLLCANAMSDVTFFIGKNERKFYCHKLILATGSGVFRAMFYGGIPEEKEVYVTDVTPRGFYLILEYLYCDDIHLNTQDDAFEAGYAAKKYLLNDIVFKCEQFLLCNVKLTPYNVSSIYEKSDILEMRVLKTRCQRFICRNFSAIVQCNKFKHLPKSLLEEIVTVDLLEVDSECEVIEALLSWSKFQCLNSSMEITRNNIRKILDELLKHVRFLSLTTSQFQTLIREHEFLEQAEELAILLNISLPKKEELLKMPSGFNTISTKRCISNCCKLKLPIEYRYNNCDYKYSVKKQKLSATLSGTNRITTVLGVTISTKPIPGYSNSHQYLSVDVLLRNSSTNANTSSNLRIKPCDNYSESVQELHFLDPLIFIENETVELTAVLEGEGVLLPSVFQKCISWNKNDCKITIEISDSTFKENCFVIKEILYC